MRQEIAFIDFLFGVLLNLDGFVERLSIHSHVFLRVVGLRTSEIFPLLEAFLITKFFITTSTAYSFTKMDSAKDAFLEILQNVLEIFFRTPWNDYSNG